MQNIQRVCASLERTKYRIYFFGPSDFEARHLNPECAHRIFGHTKIECSPGIANVGYSRQSAETGDGLAQEFESLANNIGSLTRQPSYVAARSG
jgi:hypothetical protein